MDYLFFIVLFCYVAMQSVETISFNSRIAGKLTGKLALGTTVQTSIFTMSRLFLPPILLTLSYMIESGLSLQHFLLTAISLVSLSFFVSLLIFFNLNFFQGLFQKLFFLYGSNSLPVAILKLFSKKQSFDHKFHLTWQPKLRDLSLKKVFAASFSYLFLSIGFLIAFSLAILIPEYRMTMSQLITAFHGIGAVFIALYIDPMMSRSLDVAEHNTQWVINIYSILLGRILSYVASSLIFIGLYLYALLM